MLSFLKKIFGAKPADPTPAPYKVEKASEHFPFPKQEKLSKKSAVKKPAAKRPAKKTTKPA